ncbi:hypothetical protein NHX12_012607 [Muraenolepis orangiensis]|uniref:Transcription cofactor vestigial-like protein 4 n=1 Tax=Muraenolepis orangiensis TaxID=630683 RepID=A0A9Q0DDB8_9TELE|nr:hypothetical protein NHX12_012607 [Muraenolepis orangiensis]
MDLLTPQRLDEMNNHIGRLHYDGDSRIPSLPSPMPHIRTGPPPLCPSKRKYGAEKMDDPIECDKDHGTKMSRLFASQLAQRAGGDNRNERWSHNHSPAEHVTSSSNGLHGNHLYDYAMDQPLVLTKSSLTSGAGPGERAGFVGPAERQQNRPSVIICAPASSRSCSLSQCHMNGGDPAADQRKANVNPVCDPVIEEHFRRSLGKNYKQPEPVARPVSVTDSVDDHFAKALGETWLQIKAKGGDPPSPESDS